MGKKWLRSAAVWGGVCLLFLLLLPLTLPVVLGILAAAALDRRICQLRQKTGMGRGGASAITVTAALSAAGVILWGLGRMLLRELSRLSRRLPDLLETAARYGQSLSRSLQHLGEKLPGGIGDAFRAWAQGLFSGTLAGNVYDKLFSTVSGLLSALPGSLFFLVTMVLSCYFAAAELPRLRELLRMHLPARHMQRLTRVFTGIRTALGGWIRAQLRLMGVTFLVLAAGFALLRADSPLLLAVGIAALDALPVFGTGTVLIPWALVEMMTGDLALGIGLLILYGTAALLRNILEPKLLGAQLGLSPLLTLVAIYAGWRIGGFWGMILLPVGLMVGASLWIGARTQPAEHPAPDPVFPPSHAKYPEK